MVKVANQFYLSGGSLDKHVHVTQWGATGLPIPLEGGGHTHSTAVGTSTTEIPIPIDGDHIHEYRLRLGSYTGGVVASSTDEGKAD